MKLYMLSITIILILQARKMTAERLSNFSKIIKNRCTCTLKSGIIDCTFNHWANIGNSRQ